MAFDAAVSGNLAVATSVQQLIDAWTGVAGAGEPLSLTSVRSSSWGLTVRNLDTANGGRALRVLKSDDPSTVLFSVDDLGITTKFKAGTISAPSITFADGTTGIYKVGTHSMALVSNSVARLTIDTSGVIAEALSTSSYLLAPNGTALAPTVRFGTSSSEAGLYSPTGADVAIATGGAARVTVTDGAVTLPYGALVLSSASLGYIDLPFVSAPAAPSSGTRLYTRTGGGVYVRSAAGSERELVDTLSTQSLDGKTLNSPILQTPTISTLTTNGDLLYGTGSGVLARRGIGSTGQALTVVGGVPNWAASATSVLDATGATLYASAANTLAKLAAGTTRQIMTMNTAGNAPEWATVSKGPTFYVAASDAQAGEKAGANYLCDGTADDVEINAAITALPSTGGRIELSSGTFTINAAINTNKAGITLVGQGKNTIIKVVNSAAGSFANSSIIYNTAADITFRDFKLNANRSNNAGHSTYSGINFGAGSTGTILVDGVWVDNFAVYGFDISSSVTGGRFVNCRASTGVDGGYGFMVRDSATAVALFNCVSNSNTGGGFHSQGTRVTYVACLAYSNTGSGFETAYGTATDNRYAACLAYSNSAHGFHTISPAVRPSYVGCTADNNGGHGFNIVSGVTGANVMDCVSHSNGTAANNTYQNFAFNGTDGYINGCMARVGANVNKPSYGMAVAGTNNYVGYNDLYGSGNVSDYIEGGTNTRKPARVQASVAGGDTIASTAAETNFATNHVFPAGTLTSVGKLLKVRAWGTYSTLGSGTVTLQLKLKMGSTTLIDFGSITTAISIASRRWDLEAELLVAGVGGSGPIEAAGKARIPTANTDVGFSEPAIGGSITIDTTASQTLQISAQHGASSASNTITMRQFSVVTLN